MRRRPIIHWKDESKNVKKRSRRIPPLMFTPMEDLIPGAMFVSRHRLEPSPNEQWDIPTLVPRKKHVKKNQVSVLIYAGSIRLEKLRRNGRHVNHIKHVFIMEGGRYIVDALEYLNPVRREKR